MYIFHKPERFINLKSRLKKPKPSKKDSLGLILFDN